MKHIGSVSGLPARSASRYDEEGIDDGEHSDLDYGERRAVDEMLNRRDERARQAAAARRGQSRRVYKTLFDAI